VRRISRPAYPSVLATSNQARDIASRASTPPTQATQLHTPRLYGTYWIPTATAASIENGVLYTVDCCADRKYRVTEYETTSRSFEWLFNDVFERHIQTHEMFCPSHQPLQIFLFIFPLLRFLLSVPSEPTHFSASALLVTLLKRDLFEVNSPHYTTLQQTYAHFLPFFAETSHYHPSSSCIPRASCLDGRNTKKHERLQCGLATRSLHHTH